MIIGTLLLGVYTCPVNKATTQAAESSVAPLHTTSPTPDLILLSTSSRLSKPPELQMELLAKRERIYASCAP